MINITNVNINNNTTNYLEKENKRKVQPVFAETFKKKKDKNKNG